MAEAQIAPWVADKLRAMGIPASALARLAAAAVRPGFFGKVTLKTGLRRAILHYEHGGIVRIETVAGERFEDGTELELSESTIPVTRGVRFEKR